MKKTATAKKRAQQLKFVQWIRLIGFVAIIAIVLTIIIAVNDMLLSCVLALVLNYLLGPIVNAMERAGTPRVIATTFVFLCGGVLVGLSIAWAAPWLSGQVTALRSQVPVYISGVSSLIAQFETYITSISGVKLSADFPAEAEAILFGWTRSVFQDLPAFLSTLGTTLLLAPFFAFFLIKDGRVFVKNFLGLAPNHIFEMTLNLYYQINNQVGQFVRARLMESIIVGLVVLVGLWVIKFPFAIFLAAFAGLTNLIPYVGPLIGAVPALVMALVNGDSGFQILMVLCVFGTAQLIDTFFIIPMVVAKIINLHPITVIVAMIVGAQLLGILGMIIAIPVASALKVTFVSVYQHLVDFRA